MAITLSDDTTKKALGSLKRYFDERRDEELGDLQAHLLLEYIIEEIGPSIYNAALADAQGYLRERLDDLDGACGVPEFGYWTRTQNRRGAR
ncbi:MAG TPA: DUF2164 domain-containing protein [Gemmatimonadaceae bacterium]|nr:DUF2164 domain-containing protein [Gemmatimonadaceae bacterium]